MTFQSGKAIRMTNISEKAPKNCDLRWRGLRSVSDSDLFKIEKVNVHITENDLPGRPRQVAQCCKCGETVTDGREVLGADGAGLMP